MAIQDVIRGVGNLANAAGRGLQAAWNRYSANDRQNGTAAAVHVLGAYGLGAVVPDLVGADYNLAQIGDIAAPLLAGGTALYETRQMAEGVAKNITQLAIGTITCALTAGQINEFQGAIPMVHQANYYLSKFKNMLSMDSYEGVGGTIGLASTAVAKVLEAYGRRNP